MKQTGTRGVRMIAKNAPRRLDAIRRFPILYGCFWALCFAAIGTLILCLISPYGDLQQKTVTIAAYLIHCISVLFGAIAASRQVDARGWFHGGATGLLYALTMVVIGLFVYNTFTMDGSGLFRVLLMAVIGAFGGMIGMATSSRD